MSELLPCRSCDGSGVDLYDGTPHDCQVCCGRGVTRSTHAPCDELVRYSLSLDWQGDIITAYGMVKDPEGKYVRYDKAAAIIAEERMKLEATAKAGLQLSEQVEALEADNASKNARIEELERRLKEVELEHTGVRNSYFAERRKASALEADNKRLREALELIRSMRTVDAISPAIHDFEREKRKRAWQKIDTIVAEALGEVKT